jgi:sugar lactone lactonase YvrE
MTEAVIHAVACTTPQTILGEGPRWDGERDELLRVDILAGEVHRERIGGDGDPVHVRTLRVPGTVGAVAPVEGSDDVLIASGRGFARLTADGRVEPLAQVAPSATRMNDGACDPQGRFWAGTVGDGHRGGAALYRLDRDGRADMVLDGLTTSNGVGWSPDGTIMYLVDSGPRVVREFSFDQAEGVISGGRRLVEMPPDAGTPDGLTVDAAGDLWVAIHGAGRVHRYSPEGLLRQVVMVPAEQTTACAFAGPGLDHLYITTATEGWDDARRAAEPGAGIVYRAVTGARGRPAAPFRPDPWWWGDRG